MLLQDFIARYTGVAGVGDTPENKGQCVGLVQEYINTLGAPHVWGHAKDLLNNADKNAYDIILKTPDNFPLPGDIPVWDSTWGNGFGHTAIVVSANAAGMQVFEQNSPFGYTPRVRERNYSGVVGWMRVKQPVAETVEVTPAEEEYYQEGDYKVNLADKPSMIEAAKIVFRLWRGDLVAKQQFQTQLEATNTCQTQLKTAVEQNEKLQGQVGQLQTELKDVKSKYDESERAIIALKGQLEAFNKEDRDYAQKAYDMEHLANERKDYIHAMADGMSVKHDNKDDKQLVEEVLDEMAKQKRSLQLSELYNEIKADEQVSPPAKNDHIVIEKPMVNPLTLIVDMFVKMFFTNK